MKNPTWKLLVGCLVLAVAPFAARAEATREEAEKLVADSARTLDGFVAEKDMAWLRAHAREARGLVICAQVVKAGFIIGGSGGRCVFVAKGAHGWNGPAFYSVGTASAGFQAGVQDSEILALVMTQKAVDSLMSNSFKLGGEASAAAGPVGAGVGAAATPKSDVIYFSKSKGLFGGVDVSGAVMKPSDDFNKAYYGKEASPIDIIVRGSVHNKTAHEALIARVEKLFAGR
jgi:lipid-binding SYLF domain-containing protein